MESPRVCVIGAGPSGMSALYHFAQHPNSPEIQCFEKQSDWCGLWNYTWQTGTDEFGELCHGSMYRHLWSNAPKEVLEFPDYTFEEHFGKLLPSFAPRSAIRDYVVGRYTKATKNNFKSNIKFNTPVRHVQYRKSTDDFLVTVQDNKEDMTFSSVFTHVIVASGIFSVPNKPAVPGIDTFEGLVIHSHDFREAKAYAGKRLLCIGSSYSAEDVSIQCLKFGAKRIICTWKTNPTNYKFPDGIEERPLVERFDKKTAFFKDGSSAEIDVVVFCTGYKYHHPYLEDGFHPRETISLYPDHLYKGIVWMKGGNNKLLFIGNQNQFFSFPMFEQQAKWITKYVMGNFQNLLPKQTSKMADDVQIWRNKLKGVTCAEDGVDFQAEYMHDLADMTGYRMEIDTLREYFKRWLYHRKENIATYRDQSFASTVTGKMTPSLKSPWFTVLDDTMGYYLKSC